MHKGNVYVGDAAALHTLEGPDARELGTVLVKVLFKIVVDPSLHIACEALLSFGVAVTEIVTVATGDEVETVGLIGRPGAIVRGPVTARRTLGVARVSKLTAVGEAAGAVRCLERRRCCRFDSLVCYQLGGGLSSGLRMRLMAIDCMTRVAHLGRVLVLERLID